MLKDFWTGKCYLIAAQTDCSTNLGCEGLRHRNDLLSELTGEVLFICLSGLKCSQNAGKVHSEGSKFQIFLGEHAPKPPSNGARKWPSESTKFLIFLREHALKIP